MRRALLVAVLSVATTLGGAALGSVALFAFGVGIAGLALGAALLVAVAARRLRVEREIDRREVVEGGPLTLRIALRGIARLPVHVEAADGDGWCRLGRDGGTIGLAIDRPGGHRIEPTPLRVRDDLGLWSRPVEAGPPQAVLVLPRPAASARVAAAGAERAMDPEPDGLRPYVPGTAMSRIAWRASARLGELHERATAPGRDRLPLLVVDTAGSPDPAAVAWAARTAAGEALALVRGGGCRILLPGDGTPATVTDPTADWPPLHRRLARLLPDGPVDERAARGGHRIRAAAAPPEAAALAPLPRGVVALARESQA